MAFDVRYQVQAALNYGPDYDELYWKMTFPERSERIEHATAAVHLPGVFRREQIRVDLFALSHNSAAWVDEEGGGARRGLGSAARRRPGQRVLFPAGAVQAASRWCARDTNSTPCP